VHLKHSILSSKENAVPTPWRETSLYSPRKGLAREFANEDSLPAAGRAQGIAAESPQDLHKQIRGLAAESPVFLPAYGQKNAPKDSRFPKC
jgi:hypothetical protein